MPVYFIFYLFIFVTLRAHSKLVECVLKCVWEYV